MFKDGQFWGGVGVGGGAVVRVESKAEREPPNVGTICILKGEVRPK